MITLAGCKTDIGRKRAQNQDSFSHHPEMGLYVVADGMGGHQGGETASLMAVQLIPERFKALKDKKWDNVSALKTAIMDASNSIHLKAKEQPKLEGMGTTAVTILIEHPQVYIGHVGDSRCYLIRHHRIWQLTRDHSLVQEKLKAGLITREKLKTDKMKNVITRSVGFEEDVDVDVYEMQIQPGDVFVLCSDGLSGPLTDELILNAVEGTIGQGLKPQDTAERLIQEANQHGGDDNITAIVLHAKELA